MQPLPDGQDGRAHAADLGITDQTQITFLVIGDSGGVKDPNPQNAVSNAMQARAPQDPKPAFVYTVGDIVYFNGDATEYTPQFYEAYGHLQLPIVGIPGNHDGDTTDDPTRKPLDTFMANFCAPKPALPPGNEEYTPQFYEAYGHLQLPIVGIPGNHDGDTTDDPTRKPLDTFMANFCAPKPALPPGNEEYNRDVETQPYCDWTLLLNAATVIGIYTNVPSGGHLEQSQVDWLTAELAAAPAGKPVIVTCHHPPYSVDQMHGGSQVIGAALDGAFASSGRTADLVLSGHVHDYQRFTVP